MPFKIIVIYYQYDGNENPAQGSKEILPEAIDLGYRFLPN